MKLDELAFVAVRLVGNGLVAQPHHQSLQGPQNQVSTVDH